MAPRPADRPWDELSEDDRRSSRHQVDGMINQLHAVWYQIAPRYDWDEQVEPLQPSLVEAMAELEHARWAAHKRAEGFRYGPGRAGSEAEAAPAARALRASCRKPKRTSTATPWRDVRGCSRSPTTVSRRSSAREALARLLHERYVAGRLAAGDPEPRTRSSGRTLAEELREDNRRHVDDFAVS